MKPTGYSLKRDSFYSASSLLSATKKQLNNKTVFRYTLSNGVVIERFMPATKEDLKAIEKRIEHFRMSR